MFCTASGRHRGDERRFGYPGELRRRPERDIRGRDSDPTQRVRSQARQDRHL